MDSRAMSGWGCGCRRPGGAERRSPPARAKRRGSAPAAAPTTRRAATGRRARAKPPRPPRPSRGASGRGPRQGEQGQAGQPGNHLSPIDELREGDPKIDELARLQLDARDGNETDFHESLPFRADSPISFSGTLPAKMSRALETI